MKTAFVTVALAGTLALGACASTKPAPAAPSQPAAAIPPPAPTKPAGSGKSAAPDEATLAQYRKWISEARAKHPYADSEDRMYAVMMCESRGKAGIINPYGGYIGLFQYAPATWSDTWNIYKDGGIKDARSQIFATALAWKLKMQSHWGCYKKTG